jgi:hypothetical protein
MVPTCHAGNTSPIVVAGDPTGAPANVDASPEMDAGFPISVGT